MNIKCLFLGHKWDHKERAKREKCLRCGKRSFYAVIRSVQACEAAKKQEPVGGRLDLSKYRGDTAEEDRRVLWETRGKSNAILFLDYGRKVNTVGGVWIASVHRIAPGEESLQDLLNKGLHKK